MKYLLTLILSLLSVNVFALECIPLEWGGTGLNYRVGTTTSGTWYVWNCAPGKAEGVVIVKGHKPSASCLASQMNPFADPNTTYKACYSVSPEENAKYVRLLKSLETAKSKLPKE